MFSIWILESSIQSGVMCLRIQLGSPGVLIYTDIAGPQPWSTTAWESAFLVYFPDHYDTNSLLRTGFMQRNGIERNGLGFRGVLVIGRRNSKL